MELNHDMSRYMQTGPLLHSAYLLASDRVGLYVNTVKPSARALFAFGALGRLHNVLYDLDCTKLYSDLYGIYPLYRKNGRSVYPYRSGHDIRSTASFQVENDVSVRFDERETKLTLERIPMYEQGRTEACDVMPELSFSVEEDRVRILARFPAEAENAELYLPWYPLYDSYTADGTQKDIQYYRHGFYGVFPDGYRDGGYSEILLEDSFSRQAGVQILAAAGSLTLYSHTETRMGNAAALYVKVAAKEQVIDVTLRLFAPPMSVRGAHYYPCGTDAQIETAAGIRSFSVPSVPGVHTLSLENGGEYSYCAVPERRDRMKSTAEACRKLFWKEGNLQGTPPYAFDPAALKPRLRSNMRYCSHGMRAISCLAAAGVHDGDISYVEDAAHALRQVAAVSFHGEDGSIFTPLMMDDAGDPGPYRNSSRPSDSGILIRGWIHTAKAFLHFGETEKAKECVRSAASYARTIRKMQNPDGSFFDRYRYPDLEPAATNRGTVNNWCLQLWNLIPLLRFFGMEQDAEQTLSLIRRYIRYQTEKENSILFISGGGEDASDFGDALNTDATLFAMQYILTGEGKWKEYAEQALKKSWLLSCMWADMPQFFGLYGNSDLGDFYDQPHGMFSAGGMHDLTAVEANLFAADVLESEFAQDMADRLHCARLGSFIRENGGMYMVMLQCPNYSHRDERHSEMLMYGGVGVYAWTEAEKSSDSLKKILRDYPIV